MEFHYKEELPFLPHLFIYSVILFMSDGLMDIYSIHFNLLVSLMFAQIILDLAIESLF